MRVTNYRIGTMKNGFDSMYASQFNSPIRGAGADKEQSQAIKANVGSSHWDHSKAWRPSYKSEQRMCFRNVKRADDFLK